jgi:hypothetical protein
MTRRRNALWRKVFVSPSTVPVRAHSFVPGSPEFYPTHELPVLDDPMVLRRVELLNEQLFNPTSVHNTPARVMARNVDSLLRGLRKSFEFEDMVDLLTGDLSRDSKRAVLIYSFMNPHDDLVREAVKLEFHLNEHQLGQAWPQLMYSLDPAVLPGMQKVVRAVYNRTQLYLRHKGITSVTLFRGVPYTVNPESVIFPQWRGSDFFPEKPLPYQRLRADKLMGELHDKGEGRTVVTYHASALSSWTGALGVAHAHSNHSDVGVILAATFPVGRILSIPFTGWGSMHEREVCVIGGSMEVLGHVWLPAQTGTKLLESGEGDGL